MLSAEILPSMQSFKLFLKLSYYLLWLCFWKWFFIFDQTKFSQEIGFFFSECLEFLFLTIFHLLICQHYMWSNLKQKKNRQFKKTMQSTKEIIHGKKNLLQCMCFNCSGFHKTNKISILEVIKLSMEQNCQTIRGSANEYLQHIFMEKSVKHAYFLHCIWIHK